MSKREKPKGANKAIRGRGGGHGTKPSQRRDQKINSNQSEQEYLDEKRIQQIRDRLGGVVDKFSNEDLLRIYQRHDNDVDETCDAILGGEGASSEEG